MNAIFFSVNDMGLGHLRRSAAILLSLRSVLPDLKPLIVTNAHHERFLQALRIPAVILPRASNTPRNGPDQLETRVAPEVFDELALGVIQAYRPEVIAFDTYVGSRLAREFSRYVGHSCLVFRKCRPETFVRYVRADYFGKFELVLVPHEEDEFKCGLPPTAVEAFERRRRVVYAGPIVFPAGIDDSLPQPSLPEGAKVVVLLGGGGGYDAIQSEFFAQAREAVRHYSHTSPTQVHCMTVVGPFTPVLPAHNDPTLIVAPIDARRYIDRADLVIAHGGYNTVNEIIASGTRAIFCPFYRKTEDQRERVDALKHRSGTAIVSPDISTDELTNVVGAVLDSPRPAARDLDGAARAARAIRDLVTLGKAGVVDVLWSDIRRLLDHPMLPTMLVQVRLESGDCATLHDRASQALDGLESIGIELADVSVCFADGEGGAQLPALAKLLSGRRFKSLTASISADNQASRADTFRFLEACRSLQPHFAFEITTGLRA
jgi:predicted glycosyltransferase